MLVELSSLGTKHPSAIVQMAGNLGSSSALHRVWHITYITRYAGADPDRAFLTMVSISLNLNGSKLNGFVGFPL